jgi:hypothetical protein
MKRMLKAPIEFSKMMDARIGQKTSSTTFWKPRGGAAVPLAVSQDLTICDESDAAGVASLSPDFWS